MIEKVMNFFWNGDTLSWMRFLTLKSFCHYHKDWTTKLWLCPGITDTDRWKSPEEQDFFRYKGMNYFDHVKELPIEVNYIRDSIHTTKLTPVQNSDVFRWGRLASYNGWYADMDILWTGELQTCEEGIAICQTRGHMAIGLMGSNGKNLFYKHVYNRAKLRAENNDYQSAGTKVVHEVLTGRPGLTKVADVQQLIYDEYGPVKDYPEITVYPWYYTELDNVFLQHRKIPQGCVGIHWYGGSKLGQRANCLLREDMQQLSCTFTDYARAVV